MSNVKFYYEINMKRKINEHEERIAKLVEMEKHTKRLERLLDQKVSNHPDDEMEIHFNVISKNKNGETYYSIDNTELTIGRSMLESIIKMLIDETSSLVQKTFDGYQKLNGRAPTKIFNRQKYYKNYHLDTGYIDPDDDDNPLETGFTYDDVFGDDESNDKHDTYDEPFPLKTEPVKNDYHSQKPDPSNDKLIERLNDIESEHDGGY